MITSDAWRYDSRDLCLQCHLPKYNVENIEGRVQAHQAAAVSRMPKCGHIIIYRSTGLWTALIKPVHYYPPVAQIL